MPPPQPIADYLIQQEANIAHLQLLVARFLAKKTKHRYPLPYTRGEHNDKEHSQSRILP